MRTSLVVVVVVVREACGMGREPLPWESAGYEAAVDDEGVAGHERGSW